MAFLQYTELPGGVIWPTEMRVEITTGSASPAAGTARMKMTFSDLALNPELPPGTFAFTQKPPAMPPVLDSSGAR